MTQILAPPEPSPPQVVVTPIPKSQSTTLRLNKWYPIWTVVAAAIVTILDFAMQALADPVIGTWINRKLPPEARLVTVAVVALLAAQNWKKRMGTTAPIEGTPAAKGAMRLLGIALVCLLAAGCAESRLYIGYYADKILHPGNPKVLTFYGTPSGQLVGARWTRLCDVADCAMHGPEKGAGIFTPTPKACYSRWADECFVKGCTHCRKRGCGKDWWEKCAKQENAKEITNTQPSKEK